MKKILIATGGSGGHVIPSLSIYDHLKEDFEIKLVTDQRGVKYINNKNYQYKLIEVPNLFSKIYLLPFNLIKFFISIIKSYIYLNKNKIDFLISMGGYISFPLSLRPITLGSGKAFCSAAFALDKGLVNLHSG